MTEFSRVECYMMETSYSSLTNMMELVVFRESLPQAHRLQMAKS